MKTPTKPSAIISADAEEPIISRASRLIRLKLDTLSFDQAFSPRPDLAKAHVLDLARALHNCDDLDPIKVWKELGTNRLIVIDGRHRFEAYRFKRRSHIPAIIFHGNYTEARLEAGTHNSKTTFPWSTAECTQYAWGLVIEGQASKLQISRHAAVSTSMVGNMRRRLKEMTAAGSVPSGNWFRDRNDKLPEGQLEDDTTAAQLARVKKLKDRLGEVDKWFKDEFGIRCPPDDLGQALRWHLGQPRFKLMASGGCLFDEDEFSQDPECRPLGQPEMDF
jgi:hypothetical protein